MGKKVEKSRIDADVQVFVDWMERGLKTKGKTLTGLAECIGLTFAQGRRISNGDRKLGAAELAPISEYLGLPVPRVGITDALPSVPVLCEVSNGTWLESSPFRTPAQLRGKIASVPFAPDHPTARQFALIVHDDSVSKFIPNGHYAIFLPLDVAHRLPREGDIVAVEISRNGLFSCIVRQLRQDGGNWELRPAAYRNVAAPSYRIAGDFKPTSHKNETIAIKGIAIASYQPL